MFEERLHHSLCLSTELCTCYATEKRAYSAGWSMGDIDTNDCHCQLASITDPPDRDRWHVWAEKAKRKKQISSKATAAATEEKKKIGTLETQEFVRIWLFLLGSYLFI